MVKLLRAGFEGWVDLNYKPRIKGINFISVFYQSYHRGQTGKSIEFSYSKANDSQVEFIVMRGRQIRCYLKTDIEYHLF